MRCQPSTELYYFKEQYDHSSSDFASLSHLLPQEKAHLGVHSPTEILIFLDHYKRDVEGAVPYLWILNLCRPVGERLAAPATNGLIKTKPDNCRDRRPDCPNQTVKGIFTAVIKAML